MGTLLIRGPEGATLARGAVGSILSGVHEGDLVRKAGKWITKAPKRCPNGHPLGPNQVLVGHVACLGHGGGGHTTWHCRTCDAVVSGPPLNTHCTKLEGPGALRISTKIAE